MRGQGRPGQPADHAGGSYLLCPALLFPALLFPTMLRHTREPIASRNKPAGMRVNTGAMSKNETNTTAAPALVALGEADADACTDGFCVLTPAPEEKPGGAGE